jgi:hypothetical protein
VKAAVPLKEAWAAVEAVLVAVDLAVEAAAAAVEEAVGKTNLFLSL